MSDGPGRCSDPAPSLSVTVTVDASPAVLAAASELAAALRAVAAAISPPPPAGRFLTLSRGTERPRTPEGSTMASSVHVANELVYDINAVDAITGAAADLSGITFSVAVEPPGAGELTVPDADGKFVFRPAQDSGVSTCAIEVRAEFADGSDPVTLADSVTIDPDGRVLGMGAGVEQPRTA